MAINTWPGTLAGGSTQLLIPPTAPMAGMKISDGLPPVPEKLVAKIRRGEFVELHELLPECLAESTDSTGPIPRARKRLNDKCMATVFHPLRGVLASSKPALVPDLMAYMISIIRASQEFEGSAWMVYDDAYRHQAAAAGDQWQWSQVNPSLYTICFTGKAKRTGRCERCLSAAHRQKSVHYRTRMIPIWQSASRQSRQQSWPSPSRARRACPEGNLARSAESTIGGSAPSATASMGTAVPPVGETTRQWSAPQWPPVQTKGQT